MFVPTQVPIRILVGFLRESRGQKMTLVSDILSTLSVKEKKKCERGGAHPCSQGYWNLSLPANIIQLIHLFIHAST